MVSTRALALVVLVAVGVFGACMVVAHATTPGYDPVRQHLSELALTRSETVFVAGVEAMAVGVFAFAALVGRVLTGTAGRAAAALAVLAGLGIVLVGAFPTDGPLGPPTTGGRIHTLGTMMGFGLGTLVVLALGLAAGADPRWRPLRVPAFLLAGAAAALIAALQLELTPWGGVVQRLLVVSIVGGIAVVAARALALERSSL